MKLNIRPLALTAMLGATLNLQAAPTLVPNGDFETPAGASWGEVSGGGTFVFSYPATGGNPDGYGVIDHSANDGGFGIWVANGDAEITLASLGLTAGSGYVFTQDMTILSGTNIGGFKVDFFAGGGFVGSTGDVYPALIGDGTTWETYSFTVAIPVNADAIKVVPLWGPGSSIGYDNICVDPTPIPVPPIPNGDFENGSASWFEIGDGTTWSYPSTGGNPDGYGVMTNNGTGFGIWVANAGAPLALASLGLSGGDTVTFTQDMRILTGTSIGGLKIEFLEGALFLGDTGDMFPALIGDGSTWETYSFEVPIPGNADHIKVVPLWGSGSSVCYDNITFIQPEPTFFLADIKTGTFVNWTATSTENSYQPQESADNAAWTDLGPIIEGSTVTSRFDSDASPFYRVQEFQTIFADVAVNGDFEIEDEFDPLCAASWACIGTQLPTRITTDVRTGVASMQLKVENAADEANTSEIQQNVTAAGGTIIPGETYEFSFWAKQISSGVSYVQQYRVQWLDISGAILGGGVGFNPFTGGTGGWIEISAPSIVAPAGADTAFIQVFGATGAVTGGLGEVLIDDLTLDGATTSLVGTLPTTTSAGVEICWPTIIGKDYQVKSSTDLVSFADFGASIAGDGETASATDLITPPVKFYQVEETP